MVIKHTRHTFVLILTIAFIAAGYSWFARTKRVELYQSGLNPQELPQLSRALSESGFEHGYNERFDGILVAPGELVAARVALARAGLPRKIGFAWDVNDPEGHFEDYRLATTQAGLEECLSHYPELAEYKVNLQLSCQTHCYVASDHLCEQAYILALEKPGQGLTNQQVHGLLSLLALSEPKLRRVQVVRDFGNSEPARTVLDLESRQR